MAASYLKAGFGTLNQTQRLFLVCVGILELLFAHLALTFRAFHIDVRCFLGTFGKNRDLIRQDLGKAPMKSKAFYFAIRAAIVKLATTQFGNEGSVAGQNAEISRRSRYLRFGGLLAYKQALRSDDFDLERVRHDYYAAAFIF